MRPRSGEKMTQMGWAHKHTTLKRIELERPGYSGFEILSIFFKT